jgi:hypothetical protein
MTATAQHVAPALQLVLPGHYVTFDQVAQYGRVTVIRVRRGEWVLKSKSGAEIYRDATLADCRSMIRRLVTGEG